MSNLRFVSLLAIAFITTICGESRSAIEFVERWRFTIPGLPAPPAPGVPNIDQVCLKDINDDGTPEALVLRGKLILLFSPSQDSVLFRDSLTGGGMRRIYLGDVDRDSIADIVSAVIYGGNSVSDSAIAIDLYGGATGFSVRRSYYSNVQISQPNPGYFPPGALETHGITAMTAFDLNEDGFDEFMFSYGYKETFQDKWALPRWVRELRAAAYLFYSFPDSVQRTLESSLADFRPMMINGLPMLAGAIRSYQYFADMGPDYERDFSHASIMTLDGQFLSVKGTPTWSSIGYPDDYNSERYHLGLACAGDFQGFDPYTEIITQCYDCADYPGISLRRVIGQDSTELIWTRTGHYLANIVYLSDNPGSFFGFYGDQFIQYNDDGYEIQSVSPIPTATLGRLAWVYPFGLEEPYLQAILGDTISLYEVAVSTGTDDGGNATPMPGRLSIAPPYPNPFNAVQRIPVTVPAGQHLTVQVFNLLGQRIAKLYNGRATGGTMEFDWSAQGCASGVYFVRAVTSDETRVVRSILLK